MCERRRVMFVYWGRRGALSQFTLEVARAALNNPTLRATVSVSRQNELFPQFEQLGPALWPIDTFTHSANALLTAWRIPELRRRFHEKLRADRTQIIIELMPHVWSFLLMPMAAKAGAKYCSIVHDAVAHPGDMSGLAKGVLDRVISQADVVATLSSAVALQLREGGQPPDRIVTLFHPDLTYGPKKPRRPRDPKAPMRLLHLGRIMAYKGLGLFVDMVEKLRSEGMAIEAGVLGEGPIGAVAPRLEAMGAEVINRWLTGEEIRDVLSRYDVVVLSHIEASQSGVAAAAFGAGVPVVATPVGGLVEQVIDGQTGLLCRSVDADALSETVKTLIASPALYDSICENIERTREERSMSRFANEIVTRALNAVAS